MATDVTTEPTIAATIAPSLPLHRLSVDQYYRMVDEGILTEDDRVYLWDGLLVEKMTKGRPHVIAVINIDKLMSDLVPAGWYVEQEQPLEIRPSSVPEPDLKVVRGGPRDYPDHPPTIRDAPLVVEVSDSSLSNDSGAKLRGYAVALVPVYWIVNIPAERIEVYSEPTGPANVPSYRRSQMYGTDDEVPVILDGVEVGRIAVRDVLP
jgi:Uma2 family endonuclease